MNKIYKACSICLAFFLGTPQQNNLPGRGGEVGIYFQCCPNNGLDLFYGVVFYLDGKLFSSMVHDGNKIL